MLLPQFPRHPNRSQSICCIPNHLQNHGCKPLGILVWHCWNEELAFQMWFALKPAWILQTGHLKMPDSYQNASVYTAIVLLQLVARNAVLHVFSRSFKDEKRGWQTHFVCCTSQASLEGYHAWSPTSSSSRRAEHIVSETHGQSRKVNIHEILNSYSSQFNSQHVMLNRWTQSGRHSVDSDADEVEETMSPNRKSEVRLLWDQKETLRIGSFCLENTESNSSISNNESMYQSIKSNQIELNRINQSERYRPITWLIMFSRQKTCHWKCKAVMSLPLGTSEIWKQRAILQPTSSIAALPGLS